MHGVGVEGGGIKYPESTHKHYPNLIRQPPHIQTIQSRHKGLIMTFLDVLHPVNCEGHIKGKTSLLGGLKTEK